MSGPDDSVGTGNMGSDYTEHITKPTGDFMTAVGYSSSCIDAVRTVEYPIFRGVWRHLE